MTPLVTMPQTKSSGDPSPEPTQADSSVVLFFPVFPGLAQPLQGLLHPTPILVLKLVAADSHHFCKEWVNAVLFPCLWDCFKALTDSWELPESHMDHMIGMFTTNNMPFLRPHR